MTLKVDDLTLIGTVEEIVDFLDKYKESPNRYQLAGVIWNSKGELGKMNPTEYKNTVEDFEKLK